jgi:SAM-dependent methyltransferase
MTHPEVAAFDGIWPGGYFEGDIKNPHGVSGYSAIDLNNGYIDQKKIRIDRQILSVELGYLNTLYVTYLLCLRNKVKGKTVLEIGPGRGAWSKVILEEGADKLYALDALSSTHNGFFEYVDPQQIFRERVEYFQVSDFNCGLPQGTMVDFFFSFGCFCHIRRPGTAEYFQNIFKVMKSGAEGYVMISDYKKMYQNVGGVFNEAEFSEGGSGTGVPWAHHGTEWFCNMIENIGFTVLDQDIGCNVRDPIVYFRR